MELGADVIRDAEISADGLYRYCLYREWGPNQAHLMWVMLNPSTADATKDDPTIRRCINYSKAWGYARMVFLNVFALRATDPKELALAEDPVGPLNDRFLETFSNDARQVIAAWGGSFPKKYAPRVEQVEGLLVRDGDVHCLGTTLAGQPKHPVRLPSDLEPQVWRKWWAR